MTVTVYVDDWDLPENCEASQINIGENNFPTLNLTTASLGAVLKTLDMPLDPQGDKVDPHEIANLQKALIKAVNNPKVIAPPARAPKLQGRYFFGGIDAQSIHAKLERLMEIARFAQSRSKGIYWA